MRTYKYLKIIPQDICKSLGVIALDEDERSYLIGFASKSVDKEYLQAMLSNKKVILQELKPSFFEGLLKIYEQECILDELCAKIREQLFLDQCSDQSFTDELFAFIAKASLAKNSSDIHFEPKLDCYLIKFRVDGVLQFFCKLDLDIVHALISYLKVCSKLDMDVEKSAQDGAFSKDVASFGQIDFRLSLMPMIYGTSMVLRILKRELHLLNLNALNLEKEQLLLLQAVCEKSAGLVLISGPTGSGKSTTLYATLNSFKYSQKKILTIEDPVEQRLDNLDQIRLNLKASFLFHDALHSVLRHDPDVIMIGEIRDSFSLDTALKAANTGHLVFATIHTNDSLLIINRCLDMGAKPYSLESSLCLLLAQRLVRRLCVCKEKIYHDEMLENHHIKGWFYQPVGCKECMMSGYKGRMVVAELVLVDKELKELIAKRSSYFALYKYARSKGYITMLERGLVKLYAGETSLMEVKRSLLV